MDTPPPASSPVQRTLSNTVASLATTLELLSSIVAMVGQSKKRSGRGGTYISAEKLHRAAHDVRASRLTAASEQALKKILTDSIRLARDAIAQLRAALVPSFGQRLRSIITLAAVRRLRRRWLKRPHHFTYADFHKESGRVLNALDDTQRWIDGTRLRRRSQAPTPATQSPFVVARRPVDLAAYSVVLEGEAVGRAGPTPRSLAAAAPGYGALSLESAPEAEPARPRTRRKSRLTWRFGSTSTSE